MSKREKKKASDVPVAVETTLKTLVDIVPLDSAPPAQLTKLYHAMSEFVELDYKSEQTSASFGQFLHNFLNLSMDTKKQRIWELADTLGVPRPSFEQTGAGRPTQGRNELAAVLYARHPEMLIKDRGKDARGPKRLSEHINRYLKAAGLKAPRTPSEDGGRRSERMMRAVLLELWEQVAQGPTPDEDQEMLLHLWGRAGFTEEDINKWTKGGVWELNKRQRAARPVIRVVSATTE